MHAPLRDADGGAVRPGIAAASAAWCVRRSPNDVKLFTTHPPYDVKCFTSLSTPSQHFTGDEQLGDLRQDGGDRPRRSDVAGVGPASSAPRQISSIPAMTLMFELLCLPALRRASKDYRIRLRDRFKHQGSASRYDAGSRYRHGCDLCPRTGAVDERQRIEIDAL
jgi:hypothetical protein